jgi:hypothetical protein
MFSSKKYLYKYFYKFIDKVKTNLPIFNFAVSTISLYLQFNYLFSENKNKKDNLYIYDKT